MHPQAFIQAIDPAQRADYQARAQERTLSGRQRIAEAMCGGDALYQRPADRRVGEGKAARELEANVLLSPDARLGADGTYIPGTGCA